MIAFESQLRIPSTKNGAKNYLLNYAIYHNTLKGLSIYKYKKKKIAFLKNGVRTTVLDLTLTEN